MRLIISCVLAFIFAVTTSSKAQVRVEGTGAYLQGLGWYELNDAKAASQNEETAKRIYEWNMEIAKEYKNQYNVLVNRDMVKRRMNDAAKKRFLAEREGRLRTKPTPEDIAKGDALNALLTDLSDPAIQESSWRGSKVPLPGDVSIKSLAFLFAPKPGAKENAALTRGLIALGRLDIAGRWPDVFPIDKLKSEIAAYETSYAKIRDQSLAGRLEIAAVVGLDNALKALRNKVAMEVPIDRGFRAEAVKFVDGLIEATKIFDAPTLPYAREMIADTSKHEAHTVGELLAFMRKYRLLFAGADTAPGGDEMYARLYGLLSRQVEELGIKIEHKEFKAADAQPANTKDNYKAMQGVWKIASQIRDGNDETDSTVRDGWNIERRGNQFITRKGEEFWNSGTWSLIDGKYSSSYKLVIENGQNAGKVWLGMIRWQDGDIVFCQGPLMPDEFVSLRGQGRILGRQKRVSMP